MNCFNNKRGVITLLEKRGKNPDFIKNWRPVSLTNVDYKILTKTLALRTKEIIPNIIHANQSGFVKGRYIGENIRLIQDIMEKLKNTKQSGLLLLLDFEKAFDSIEWPYMHKILEKFNFGPSYRNWIKICYTNISSTIINNGFTSGWFHISRGVRQGCPLSTILFIICVELLAQLIRNDNEIKGITIGEQEHKISLFADYTTCIVETIESVSRVFEITKAFSRSSGLNLNIDKSVLVHIGVWRVKPNIPFNVCVSDGKFNMLGVDLGSNSEECYRTNVENKISKMKTKLNIWSQRGLTLVGKVMISKSIGLSNLVYSMSNIEIKKRDLATSQQILSKFIRSGKPSKVKHSIIIQDYKLSGLRGPCMETINMSLRLAWLARLWDKSLWNSVVHQEFDKYGGLRLVLHSYFDHTRIDIPSFYKDMLLYFERLNILQPHKGVLWHNRDLIIGSKSLFRPDWLSKGIVYIRDLLGINATVLSLEELQLKFNLEVHTQIDILWYNGLKVKIKKWLTIEENQQYIQDNYKVDFDSPLFYKRASVLNIKRARCKDYTEWIISGKEEKPTSLAFWNKAGIANEETVLSSLNSCKNATKETTLVAMQFKIIHNIIATNKRKKRLGNK